MVLNAVSCSFWAAFYYSRILSFSCSRMWFECLADVILKAQGQRSDDRDPNLLTEDAGPLPPNASFARCMNTHTSPRQWFAAQSHTGADTAFWATPTAASLLSSRDVTGSTLFGTKTSIHRQRRCRKTSHMLSHSVFFSIGYLDHPTFCPPLSLDVFFSFFFVSLGDFFFVFSLSARFFTRSSVHSSTSSIWGTLA